MRELEFRAWHEGYKREHPTGFDIDPRMIYDEKLGDCLRFKNQGQPVIIMQYTGIKDNNGKKIFEGDILSSKAVVAWCGGVKEDLGMEVGFHLQWRDFESHEPLEGILYNQEEGHRIYEVIGNIYENPELKECEE